MTLLFQTGLIFILVTSCQAAGRSRRLFGFGGQQRQSQSPPPPQEVSDGHDLSNTFGHVDLPLLGDVTGGDTFDGIDLPDPSMYGGHMHHPFHLQQHQQHSAAYDMPPGDSQPDGYSNYPPIFFQQQELHAQQQQQQAFGNFPSHPASAMAAEKKQRSSVKGTHKQRPQGQYELPPSDTRSRAQKSQRWVSIEQQENDVRATDDMAQMTAAMRIAGLAPIQTSGKSQEEGYAGRQIPSGSMTSRVRRSKGKAPADARLPQEPQTARLGARTTRSEYITLDNDDDDGGEFERLYGEEATIGNYRSGNAEEHALRVMVRNILRDEWTKRRLSFFRYSAQEMAAQFAEIKIVHPGYEQGIAYQASSMVARATSGTRATYLQDFKDSTTTYTKRINYIRSRFVRNNPGLTTWDMPIEQVLHEFTRTLEKDKKERERQNKAEKNLSQKGQQDNDDDDDTPFTPQQAEIAEMLWNDFMSQLILPALNDGWAYSMSLVGTLLPRYSHDDFTPEQTQYFLIKYLHDVQNASESDLAELYQAATSSSGRQRQGGQGLGTQSGKKRDKGRRRQQ